MTPSIFPHRDSVPEAPPPHDNRKALIFAVLAHLLLLVALIFGMHWHAQNPGPVQVELWASGNSPVSPPPQTQAEAEPPKPQPESQVEPAPALPPPKVQTSEPSQPEIALEEARKKREQEQKEQQAVEAAKEKARLEEERRQAQLKEKQRLEEQRRAAEKAAIEKVAAEKKAKEAAEKQVATEKAAAEKAAAEKKAKEAAAKKAAADKALRDAFRNDALDAAGIVGGTADRNQAGGGRDDGYGAKIRACVQPGVAYPPPPRSGSANPTAQYRVQLGSNGKVMGIVLISPSGIPGFDRAVETGIRRCDPFPKPATGRYEPIIDVIYRMYD